MRLNYGLLRDAVDELDGLVISFRDVTEQDSAYERLILTESRLRDAQERAGLSSWEWTLEDNRVTVLQALPGQIGEEAMQIDALLAPPAIRSCVRRPG